LIAGGAPYVIHQRPPWLKVQARSSLMILLDLFVRLFTQSVVGRERRERVSHHDWSGDG
jgi:hypothetical protein